MPYLTEAYINSQTLVYSPLILYNSKIVYNAI